MKLKDLRHNIILFLLSFLAGWLIWALSPYFAGGTRPWDSSSEYYYGSLFTSGILLGALGRRLFLLWPVGIAVGQLVAITMLRFNSGDLKFELSSRGIFQIIWSIYGGFFYLIIFGWVCWIGSGLGAFISWRLSKK